MVCCRYLGVAVIESGVVRAVGVGVTELSAKEDGQMYRSRLFVGQAIAEKRDFDFLAIAEAKGKSDKWAEGAVYRMVCDIDYGQSVFLPIAARSSGNGIDGKIGSQWKTLLVENDYGITYEEFVDAGGLNEKNLSFQGQIYGGGYSLQNACLMRDAYYYTEQRDGTNAGIGITNFIGTLGEKGVVAEICFENLSVQTAEQAGFENGEMFICNGENFAFSQNNPICGGALVFRSYGTIENIYLENAFRTWGSGYPNCHLLLYNEGVVRSCIIYDYIADTGGDGAVNLSKNEIRDCYMVTALANGENSKFFRAPGSNMGIVLNCALFNTVYSFYHTILTEQWRLFGFSAWEWSEFVGFPSIRNY